jgi:hypothetical protein
MVGVEDHAFLTSILVGGKWAVSCSALSTFEERANSTYWIGEWVDAEANMNAVTKRNILASAGNRIQ